MSLHSPLPARPSLSTEFPLVAGSVLSPRPFTGIQLRAFELFANGVGIAAAGRQAIAEHERQARRARRRRVIAGVVGALVAASLAADFFVVDFLARLFG